MTWRIIRKSLPVFLFVAAFSAEAQLSQRSEAGVGFGTFNYTGDLVRFYNFRHSSPAGTIFYRNNISTVISFRAALTAGKLRASDNPKPIDAFGGARNASFNIFIVEGSAGFEYHFLDWRDTKRRLRFTPYLYSGICLFGMSGVPSKTAAYSNVQIAVPLSGGVKYVINPKWYAALEFGARFTGFDYLDNISDGNPSFKNFQYGNKFDNDVYYFLGLSITRTFYDIPCPRSPY
jgi:hypothetical protein